MPQVLSKDGTTIAYERQGSGPALILVGGGLDDGSENRQHMEALSKHFTVFNYARRGRGESGNTEPYALEREIEDIEALIDETEGSVYLFGASSGGALALEAVMAGISVEKCAVYEVPYMTTPEMQHAWKTYRTELEKALQAKQYEQALMLFMHLAGSSDEDIKQAKEHSPQWAGGVKLAATLGYDAACIGDGLPSPDRLGKITQPTLLMTGTTVMPGTEGLQPSFFADAAKFVAHHIPKATYKELEGESHVINSDTLAKVLAEFFLHG